MKKYFWLVAGAFVGAMSVVLAYVNFNTIVKDGAPTYLGGGIVVLEYMIVIYVLSLIEKKIK